MYYNNTCCASSIDIWMYTIFSSQFGERFWKISFVKLKKIVKTDR